MQRLGFDCLFSLKRDMSTNRTPGHGRRSRPLTWQHVSWSIRGAPATRWQTGVAWAQGKCEANQKLSMRLRLLVPELLCFVFRHGHHPQTMGGPPPLSQFAKSPGQFSHTEPLGQTVWANSLAKIEKLNFQSWEGRNRPRDRDFRNLHQKLSGVLKCSSNSVAWRPVS